jgi:hypothetical protein
MCLQLKPRRRWGTLTTTLLGDGLRILTSDTLEKIGLVMGPKVFNNIPKCKSLVDEK